MPVLVGFGTIHRHSRGRHGGQGNPGRVEMGEAGWFEFTPAATILTIGSESMVLDIGRSARVTASGPLLWRSPSLASWSDSQ